MTQTQLLWKEQVQTLGGSKWHIIKFKVPWLVAAEPPFEMDGNIANLDQAR